MCAYVHPVKLHIRCGYVIARFDRHQDGTHLTRSPGDVAFCSRISYNVSVFCSGLRGTEVRGGGVPARNELRRPRIVCNGHEEKSASTAGRRVDVHRIEAEGDDTADGRETRHLHGQLNHDAGAAGRCLFAPTLRPSCLSPRFATLCPEG